MAERTAGAYYCTRTPGHDGPCAGVPNAEKLHVVTCNGIPIGAFRFKPLAFHMATIAADAMGTEDIDVTTVDVGNGYVRNIETGREAFVKSGPPPPHK